MKKITAFVLMMITALACSFAFVSCTDNDASVTALAMNRRYIQSSYVNQDTENQRYYIFHVNGTGEYVYHYDDNDDEDDNPWHRHYKIHFKYTYVDEDNSAVVCFYDSFERLEGDDGKATVSTSWSSLVTVSKNVLSTVASSGYTFWINEDYLKTIPHFNEKTA